MNKCLHRRSAPTRCQALGSPQDKKSSGKVLVVPGYLLDSKNFLPLVHSLRNRGFDAALPPIRWYNWLPTVGGRSLRPILDRIEFAVEALATGAEVCPESNFEICIPDGYTFADWLSEFQNPGNGASFSYSTAPSSDMEKISVIGSSASGWICRILLGSGPAYDGRIYMGYRFVHTLVTLGSPHICDDGITKKNLSFVNENYPGAYESNVNYICIGGKARQGKRYLGGLIKDFAYQSYEMCCAPGEEWGDGVTPLTSALALQGAQKLILDGVSHSPFDPYPWYGSESVVEQWIHLVEKQDKDIF